jgi:FKBP-type peptidyl-prolyl cis-trans isomerase 2
VSVGGSEWTDKDSEGRLCRHGNRYSRRAAPHAELSEISAQVGDTVSVHYLGKFPGGRVFDTSMKAEAVKAGLFSPARDYKPLQVVLGAHQVISGFEDAILGMKVNESKEVTLPPEKAYGRTGRHPMAGKTLQFRLLVTGIKRP